MACALCPQRMKAAQAALIAGAPRGNPLARPSRLLLDQLVELALRNFFLGENLFRPFLKGAEALVETADDTPVEPETARRKTPQEGAVMADENEGTTELREPVFQPFDGRKIEMVGRFIEKKDIGLFREHPRQRRLAALTTGEFRRIGSG